MRGRGVRGTPPTPQVAAYTESVKPKGNLERVVNGKTANVHELLLDVDGYAAEHGLNPEDLFGVKIAIDETATNVIRHGASNESEAQLRVRLRHDDQRIELTLEDNGRTFNPVEDQGKPEYDADQEVAPVGGLGLSLIQGLAERLSYRYRSGWNRLTILYRLS